MSEFPSTVFSGAVTARALKDDLLKTVITAPFYHVRHETGRAASAIARLLVFEAILQHLQMTEHAQKVCERRIKSAGSNASACD